MYFRLDEGAGLDFSNVRLAKGVGAQGRPLCGLTEARRKLLT